MKMFFLFSQELEIKPNFIKSKKMSCLVVCVSISLIEKHEQKVSLTLKVGKKN